MAQIRAQGTIASAGRKLPRRRPTMRRSRSHSQSDTSLFRPGDVFDVAGIDEEHREPAGLEDFEERNPIHAGGFHRHRRDAAGDEPVGERLEVGRKGAE